MQCDVSQSKESEENKTKKKKKFLTEFFSGGVYRFLPALPLTPVFYRSEKFGWRGDVVAKARNAFHLPLPSSFLSLFLSPRMYISHRTPRVIYHNPRPNFFCLSTFFSVVRSPHPILAVYLLAFLFFFLGFISSASIIHRTVKLVTVHVHVHVHVNMHRHMQEFHYHVFPDTLFSFQHP